MKYSIGEISAILNISRDMIRYYEKQGIIKAQRDPLNNYRYYDTKDLFWLLEAIEHKNLNIHISDIQNMRSNNYEKQMVSYLDDYIQKQEAELRYKQILITRLKQLKDRYALGSLNCNNIWIMKIPASYSVDLVAGEGDHYEKITPSRSYATLFKDTNSPFIDSGFLIRGNRQFWQLSIDEYYTQSLSLSLGDDFTYTPSYYALCSHLDIGEFGHFNTQAIKDMLKTFAAADHPRRKDIPLNALLLSRGTYNETFHRMIELRYPISI